MAVRGARHALSLHPRAEGGEQDTLCGKYSPAAPMTVEAHVIVRQSVRGAQLFRSERHVPERNIKPLLFAEGWDEVDCAACRKRVRHLLLNIPNFEYPQYPQPRITESAA